MYHIILSICQKHSLILSVEQAFAFLHHLLNPVRERGDFLHSIQVCVLNCWIFVNYKVVEETDMNN